MQLDVALIIGVEDYPNFEAAQQERIGAVHNARCVEDWFLHSCDEIGSTPKVRTLLSGSGEEPTLSNVLTACHETAGQFARPGSRFIFYFSGHGVTDASGDDLLLCEDSGPLHAGGILLDKLIRYLSYFAFDKQVFVIDACRNEFRTMSGVDIFQKFPLGEHARPYVFQKLECRSTERGYQAHADRQRVADAGPGEPAPAYFTAGLLKAAQGEDPGALHFVREHAALCLKPGPLRRAVREYLRDHHVAHLQAPSIVGDGEKFEWHAPDIYLTRIAPPGSHSGPPSYLYEDTYKDVAQCRLAHQAFIRSLLKRMALREQREAFLDDWESERSCHACLLAPVHHAAADWLVRHVLFADARVPLRTPPKKIDLAAPGRTPDWDEFEELLCQEFAADSLEDVTTRLTTQQVPDTLIVVALEPLSARDLAVEVLERFWAPLAQQHEDNHSSSRLALVLVSDEAIHDAIPASPVAHPLSPVEPLSEDVLEGWIFRFRHELPLQFVKQRDDEINQIIAAGGAYDAVVQHVCQALEVTPPWT